MPCILRLLEQGIDARELPVPNGHPGFIKAIGRKESVRRFQIKLGLRCQTLPPIQITQRFRPHEFASG